MPQLKITDVAKELGCRWKQLSEEEKMPYQMMAKQDRERFDKENALFMKQCYDNI